MATFMHLMKKSRTTLLALALFTHALSEKALALPYELSYMGRLTESNGMPIAGPINIEVKFYRSLSGNDQVGSPITYNALPLQDGVFQLNFALTPAEFHAIFAADNSNVYVEITDLSHSKTYTRQKYSSVPYALKVPVDGTNVAYDVDGKLTVAGLKGMALPASGPSNGQVLKMGASSLEWATDNTGGGGGLTADSVTTTEIADGAIGTADLANDSVTSAKVLDGSISSADIADGSLTNADIGPSAAIADSKLATISTSGKVMDSALSPNVSLLGQDVDLSGSESIGILPTFKGGTGISMAPGFGELYIGTGSGVALGTLTAGTGMMINNGTGTITLSTTDDASLKVNKAGDVMFGSLLIKGQGLKTEDAGSNNGIAIGTCPFVSCAYPYETVQLATSSTLRLDFGGTERFLFSGTGQAMKGGTLAWENLSDIRTKDVREPYSLGLKEILALSPIVYSYKEGNPLDYDSTQEFVGFSAQDVQKVIPRAVRTNEQGYLSLTADPILWAMFNAIKEEHQLRVEEMSRLHEDLKARDEKIGKLERQIELLSKHLCEKDNAKEFCQD